MILTDSGAISFVSVRGPFWPGALRVSGRTCASLVSGISLAIIVLELLGGLHLRASGFGMVATSRGEAKFRPRRSFQALQSRHCDWVFVVHLIALVLFTVDQRGRYEIPRPRFWSVIVAKAGTLGLYFFAVPQRKRAQMTRSIVFRFLPALDLGRITLFALAAKVAGSAGDDDPGDIEQYVLHYSALSPHIYWAAWCFNCLSMLHLASSADVPLPGLIMSFGMLAVRSHMVVGDLSITLLPLAIAASCAISAWLLRGAIQRWRWGEKDERSDVEKLSQFAGVTGSLVDGWV